MPPDLRESASAATGGGSETRQGADPFPVPGEEAKTAMAATEEGSLRKLAAELQAALGHRFSVEEPVALGGMATIFKLRHPVHGGLFVAKVLRAELADRPEVLRSFQTEAAHAALLGGHPNAVPIFDACVAGGLHLLIMPFVEGEDLDRLLAANGPMSRAEALRCAAQISSLLCYAESYGITHADLTPGNLRLDIFGRFRVLDWGLSCSNAEGRPYHALGGTPLYSSPEQLRGEVPDTRSDLYSLGLVLAEMLTGRPLMLAESMDAIHKKHLGGDWQMPPAIAADPQLARLLRALLATERNARPANAFELSGALAALGFDRPEFGQGFAAQKQTTSASHLRRRRLSTE